MKVKKTSERSSTGLGKGIAGTGRLKAGESSEFQGRIGRVEVKMYEERLEELVRSIFVQGEKLSEKADIKELREYKKLVAAFLDTAVGDSHKFSKFNILDRRGRQRVYAIIKRVNQEIEELTIEVLKKEKDNLKILERLDTIKGLIMDMQL